MGCEVNGRVRATVRDLAVILSLPQLSLPFLFLPAGVSLLEGGVSRCWYALAAWPGPLAIRLYVAAPSSSFFPLLPSPLSFSASPLRLPPLRLSSGSRDVSVAAPPPVSCLPFACVSPVVFPYVCPLFSLVSFPLLGSGELLCGPTPVPWIGVSSVVLLYD